MHHDRSILASASEALLAPLRAALLTVFLCYSVLTKNITVSLPDDVYRRARILAAERDTSVSALVREFLTKLAEGESDFERRKRLQEEGLASIRNFRAGDRLTRNQVHERNAFR